MKIIGDLFVLIIQAAITSEKTGLEEQVEDLLAWLEETESYMSGGVLGMDNFEKADTEVHCDQQLSLCKASWPNCIKTSVKKKKTHRFFLKLHNAKWCSIYVSIMICSIMTKNQKKENVLLIFFFINVTLLGLCYFASFK